MYLEDFDETFKDIEGKKNILVDCFSRLPIMEKASGGKSSERGTVIDFTKLEIPKDENDVFHCNELPALLSCCNNEDTDTIKCFLNLPALQEMKCPINLNRI